MEARQKFKWLGSILKSLPLDPDAMRRLVEGKPHTLSVASYVSA